MKIASNGIQVNVLQAGLGERTLVFLHYWGGSSLEWSQVMLELSDSFRCVALDARGSGDSDAPEAGYSTRDLAADVLGVVDSLNLDDYVIVGHSMGGKAAQLIASQRPTGLRGIALVASSPPSPMAIDDAQRDQMMTAYGNRESVNWVLDNILIGSPTSAKAREQAILDALRLSPQATRGWIETGTREDFSEEARAVEVPVTVIAGDIDQVDPLTVVHAHVLPHFKQARLHVLPGKGHLLPLEAPSELASILREFVGAL